MFKGSTIVSIVKQVAEIADLLNVPIGDRESYIAQVGVSTEQKFNVHIGEINMGTSYLLKFHQDTLRSVSKEEWSSDGMDLKYYSVDMNHVREVRSIFSSLKG